MADILTQIQDELDMLLNIMQSSLSYIRLHAPPASIPGQPVLSSFAEQERQTHASQNTSQTQVQTQEQMQEQMQTSSTTLPPGPSTPAQFQADIAEMSKDLVLKEQQIEVLIASLPGLHATEDDQMKRMKELEEQLNDIEGEGLAAVKEKERLVKLVEDKIVGVGCIP